MRSKNPQAVVSRFERGNFTHDEECWQHYVAALAQTGHSEAILPKVLQRLQAAGGMSQNGIVILQRLRPLFGCLYLTFKPPL
jgi:ATP-dependent metalloprotease